MGRVAAFWAVLLVASVVLLVALSACGPMVNASHQQQTAYQQAWEQR